MSAQDFYNVISRPGFENLSYQAQAEVRQMAFNDFIATDAQYQSFGDEDKRRLYNDLVYAAPAGIDYSGDTNVAYVKSIVDGLRNNPNDERLKNEAVKIISNTRSGKESALLAIGNGIDDTFYNVIDNVMGKKTAAEENKNFIYSSKGDTVIDWLASELGRSSNSTPYLQEMASQTMVKGFVASTVDFLMTTIPLVGGVGAPGLLTKGIFSAGGNLATMAKAGSGMSKLLGMGVAQLAESVAQSGVDTLRQTLLDYWQNPDDKAAYSATQIAETFGNNVLYDYVTWAGMKTLGTIGKATLKSFGGFNTKFLDAAGQEVDLANATPEQIKQVQRGEMTRAMTSKGFYSNLSDAQKLAELDKQTKKMTNLLRIDKDSPEFHSILVSASGYDLIQDGNRWIIESIDDANNTATFNSSWEAVAGARRAAMSGSASKGVSNAVSTPIAATADRATQILVKETGKLSDLDPVQRAELLVPVKGVLRPENYQAFARSTLGGKNRFTVESSPFLKGDVTINGAQITIPHGVTSVAEQNIVTSKFLAAIENYGTATTEAKTMVRQIREILPQVEANSWINPSGLNYIAKTHLGKDIIDLGNARYSFDGVEYDSLRKVNAVVYDNLIKSGATDIQLVQNSFKKNTGLTLEVNKNAPLVDIAGLQDQIPEANVSRNVTTLYTVRNPDGGMVASSDSLPKLMDDHPEWRFGMPDTLAPDKALAGAGKISVEKGLVTGSALEILEMGKAFDDATTDAFITKQDIYGNITSIGKRSFVVKNDFLGYKEEFSSYNDALKALKKNSSDFTDLQSMATQRNLNITIARDGGFIINDQFGNVDKVANMFNLETYLGNHPVADWAKELSPLTPDQIAVLKDTAGPLANISDADLNQKLLAKKSYLTTRFFSQFFKRVEGTLESFAKNTKDFSLVKAWQEVNDGVRMANGKITRDTALFRGVLEKTPRDQRMFISSLLSRDEGAWDSINELFGGKIKPETFVAARKVRVLFDNLFKESGIDYTKYLTDYMPRIREYIHAHPEEINDASKASNLVSHAMPSTPKEIDLIAGHMRQAEFIQMAVIEDPLMMLEMYSNNINKKAYFEAADNASAALSKQWKGDKASIEWKFFDESLKRLKGESKSLGLDSTNDFIFKLTYGLAEHIKKLPWIGKTAASRVIITDLLGTLHEKFTLATQAFRPWAIPRNLLQVNNLGAALGNDIAFRAMKDVVNDGEDSMVRRCYESGAFTPTGINQGTQTIRSSNGIFNKGMVWMENSDVITRATCFRSAELLWDENIGQMMNGKMTKAQFLDALKIDLLQEADQRKMVEILQMGNREGFVDLMGSRLMDYTMFKAASGSAPILQRGFIGKLFGKNGTFPLSQIEMTLRFATQGTASKRIGRLARLAITGYATFEIFKQMGIEYSGFLMSDPLEFSGGPYWNMAVGLANSWGDDVSNEKARSDLLKTFTRSTFPTVAMFNNFSNGVNYLQNGKPYEAALAFMSAPIRSDLRIKNVYALPESLWSPAKKKTP